jgi:hypothetical protein
MLLGLLVTGLVSRAVAQGPWSVFVGGGAAGFGGASTPGTSDGIDLQFKPTPTTRFHAGIARGFGRGGLTLDASYARAGLGGYTDPGSYALNPAMTLWDIRLLVSYELFRLGAASSIRAAVGPMLQAWSGEAIGDSRTNLGAAAAVTMIAPVTKGTALLVSGSLGVAGSPFAAETLNGFGPAEPANVWTRELAVGLRLSL